MFNIAIVGIGNISSAHINGLLEFPERAKIVALCDIYPEKAEAAKKKYNLTDAVVFDDHQKMLASDIKIDIVHVCTPPYVHAEIAINSMNAGKMCWWKNPWQHAWRSVMPCLRQKRKIMLSWDVLLRIASAILFIN